MLPSVLILSQLITKLMSTPVPNPPQRKNEASFQPCTESQPGRSKLYFFSCGRPSLRLLSPLVAGDAGAARGSGCVSDQPPQACLIPLSLGGRAGDGLLDGGSWGGETKAWETQPHTQHASPAPRFKALNQLLSPPPGAPDGRWWGGTWTNGDNHRVPNGCCIASPDTSSLFSLNGTRLSSK